MLLSGYHVPALGWLHITDLKQDEEMEAKKGGIPSYVSWRGFVQLNSHWKISCSYSAIKNNFPVIFFLGEGERNCRSRILENQPKQKSTTENGVQTVLLKYTTKTEWLEQAWLFRTPDISAPLRELQSRWIRCSGCFKGSCVVTASQSFCYSQLWERLLTRKGTVTNA